MFKKTIDEYRRRDELNALLDEARREERKREVESEKKRQEHEKEILECIKLKDELIKHLEQVSVAIYSRWFRLYLESGGRIRHVYNYKAPKMYRANNNLFLPTLYGSLAVRIIVSENVTIETGIKGKGSTNLYYMDPDRILASTDASLYSDVKF